MARAVLSLLLLAVLVACAAGQTMSKCNYTASDGSKYDLAPLQVKNAATKSAYYSGVHDSGGDRYTLYVNICEDAQKASCAPASTASCQDNGSGTLTSCGLVTAGAFSDYENPETNKVEPKSGVKLTYGGGEACGAQGPRQTFVLLRCDKGADTPTVSAVEEPDVCRYEVIINSKNACRLGGGGGGGLDGGWVFIIILVVGFVVYVVAGVIIKKVKFDATGSDLMPNKDFWTALPGLVKDGVVFFFQKITCKGGYSEV